MSSSHTSINTTNAGGSLPPRSAQTSTVGPPPSPPGTTTPSSMPSFIFLAGRPWWPHARDLPDWVKLTRRAVSGLPSGHTLKEAAGGFLKTTEDIQWEDKESVEQAGKSISELNDAVRKLRTHPKQSGAYPLGPGTQTTIDQTLLDQIGPPLQQLFKAFKVTTTQDIPTQYVFGLVHQIATQISKEPTARQGVPRAFGAGQTSQDAIKLAVRLQSELAEKGLQGCAESIQTFVTAIQSRHGMYSWKDRWLQEVTRIARDYPNCHTSSLLAMGRNPIGTSKATQPGNPSVCL